MSFNSIDNLHANVLEKIRLLKQISTKIDECDVVYSMNEDIKDKIQHVERKYLVSTSMLLNEYYVLQESIDQDLEGKNKQDYRQKLTDYTNNYVQIINLAQINEELIMIVDYGRSMLLSLPQSLSAECGTYLRQAQGIVLETSQKPIKYKECCGKTMVIMDESSQFLCQICSRVMDVKGEIFDDRQLFGQNSKSTLQQNYHHSRTSNKWISQILAQDGFKFTAEEERRIGVMLERDGLGEFGSARGISVNMMRNYLKTLNYAKYYPHVATILAITTGVYPEPITEEEKEELQTIYDDVVNTISGPEYKEFLPRSNNSYCPFFMYKIIELKWRDNPERMKLLNYIYLQEPETTIKRDKVWQIYCNQKKLLYIPTVVTKTRKIE